MSTAARKLLSLRNRIARNTNRVYPRGSFCLTYVGKESHSTSSKRETDIYSPHKKKINTQESATIKVVIRISCGTLTLVTCRILARLVPEEIVKL